MQVFHQYYKTHSYSHLTPITKKMSSSILLPSSSSGSSSSGSTGLGEVHDRLEHIRTILHTFKHEQEKIILKASDEYKFRLNSLTTSSPVKASRLQPALQTKDEAPAALHQHVSDAQKKDMEEVVNKAIHIEAQLSKILNQAVVVMPMGMNIMMSQRLWPHALAAQYHHGVVRMANIESHGSLWKILPRKDNHLGTRVVLQSAVSIRNLVDVCVVSLMMTDDCFVGNWRRSQVSHFYFRIDRFKGRCSCLESSYLRCRSRTYSCGLVEF